MWTFFLCCCTVGVSVMDDEQLLDYEEEQEETHEPKAAENGSGDAKKIKGNYASIHSSGFRDFLLKPELLRAIIDCGFEHPSEVQHECIPQAILGMDIVCQAKSGMGKTAVFVLATLQQLEPVDGEVSVLVMCHTRELAFQISKEYERFSKYLSAIKVAVFFGGMPIKKDEELLRTNCPHIVVGTPGRTLALARSGKLKLDKIKYFVLDECDKMIGDADMRRDVQEIVKMTPQEKQVMMFSATLPKELRIVCKKFMQDERNCVFVVCFLFRWSGINGAEAVVIAKFKATRDATQASMGDRSMSQDVLWTSTFANNLP
ncbi:hypothetical protein Y032_0014g2222 [Ancylostoma ceylanicum]|uniref:RNA helicase n=1 Tax=Ancylostoma ceylanicum TaxID=53326 RepID=A0A016V8E4_9BILA|nr:hypothetical protein Y032_0014g2222 [Ancylostoma ceylanicum]